MEIIYWPVSYVGVAIALVGMALFYIGSKIEVIPQNGVGKDEVVNIILPRLVSNYTEILLKQNFSKYEIDFTATSSYLWWKDFMQVIQNEEKNDFDLLEGWKNLNEDRQNRIVKMSVEKFVSRLSKEFQEHFYNDEDANFKKMNIIFEMSVIYAQHDIVTSYTIYK